MHYQEFSLADFLLPVEELEKSGVPTGAELMNRTGLRTPVREQPKPMGRPKSAKPPVVSKPKSDNEILWHPDGDRLTNIALVDEDTIAKGSVIQFIWPDGRKQTIVIAQDFKAIAFTDPE